MSERAERNEAYAAAMDEADAVSNEDLLAASEWYEAHVETDTERDVTAALCHCAACSSRQED